MTDEPDTVLKPGGGGGMKLIIRRAYFWSQFYFALDIQPFVKGMGDQKWALLSFSVEHFTYITKDYVGPGSNPGSVRYCN